MDGSLVEQIASGGVSEGAVPAPADSSAMQTPPELVCSMCSQVFPSKTQLFKHLKVHGVDSLSGRPDKVVVLFGWLSFELEDSEAWVKESIFSSADSDHYSNAIDNCLLRAIYAAEHRVALEAAPVFSERPKGYSRCSMSSQRNQYILGMEHSHHALCEVACMQVFKTWVGSETEWIDAVNQHLPTERFRVLARTVLPSNASEFHAESSCSQMRFEYILPLNITMPDELAIPPSQPIIRRRQILQLKKQKAAELQQDIASVELTSEDMTKLSWTWEKWTEMDHEFPCNTPEGQARIDYFRRLKQLLRALAGKHSLHNFTTGGACPDESAAQRRIDRMYHKDIINLSNGNWVVFSISGDAFVRGEVRRILGLLLAIQRKLLPESYLQLALSKDYILEIPQLPGWFCYLAECRFAYFEGKYHGDLVIDPRRRPESAETFIASQRFEAWKTVVHEHIANISQNKVTMATGRSGASVSSRYAPNEWLAAFENHCREICVKNDCIISLRQRSVEFLQENFLQIKSAGEGGVPEVYRKVLRLLREADHSGQWPLSSVLRQKVIDGATLVEQGGVGGSFSVGALPKQFPTPRGNSLFPELLLACFELEMLLCPHRTPSSTIAINRHAQFLPHRDTGIGNGQSQSLIVALGDFAGGEVVVETTPEDIRYRPLEFDGWSARHYTMPFVGERYSLVWFTPLGVELSDLWWWDVDESGNRTIKTVVA